MDPNLSIPKAPKRAKANGETAEAPRPSAVEELIATVVCAGKTPLMLHCMTEKTILEDLLGGKRSPKETDLTPTERAQRGLYPDPEGRNRLGFPAQNLFACLREAGRLVPFDPKRKITNSEATLLPLFLTVEGEYIELAGLDDPPWVPDVRRGVNPNSGQSMGIVRPKFRSWGFTAELTLRLEAPITLATIQQLFRIAGSAYGIGAFRPEKKGNFGRFAVVDFQTRPVTNGA